MIVGEEATTKSIGLTREGSYDQDHEDNCPTMTEIDRLATVVTIKLIKDTCRQILLEAYFIQAHVLYANLGFPRAQHRRFNCQRRVATYLSPGR